MSLPLATRIQLEYVDTDGRTVLYGKIRDDYLAVAIPAAQANAEFVVLPLPLGTMVAAVLDHVVDLIIEQQQQEGIQKS